MYYYIRQGGYVSSLFLSTICKHKNFCTCQICHETWWRDVVWAKATHILLFGRDLNHRVGQTMSSFMLILKDLQLIVVEVKKTQLICCNKSVEIRS